MLFNSPEFIFLFLLSCNIFAAQLAVIPYKIVNPGTDFEISTGEEYAKLIAIASSIKKGFDSYSYYNLQIDLKNFGINPQGILTEGNPSDGNTIHLNFNSPGLVHLHFLDYL